MNKEFVPYQEALALKELGFDDEVLKVYDVNSSKSELYNYGEVLTGDDELYAPLYQQAFRWFREKYKLQVYIDFYHSESYFFKIKSQDGRYIGNTGDIILQGSPVFTRTYEEAELHCLKKLIEIVKHKNNIKNGTSKQSL
jgi:hypothetical protein